MAFTLTLTEDERRTLSDRLEQGTVTDSLRWVWENFGQRAAIGTSFQGAGLVMLHHAREAGIPLPVFTLDTGLLFPETLDLKRRLEDFFGITIEAVTPEKTVEEQSAEESPELWNTRPDLCCYLRKVAPLQNRLSTLDVWITGVRRQQAETRENVSVLELYQFDPLGDEYIYKLNPMAAWSRDKVQEFLVRHDIPQNALLSQGYRSIGCWPCTRPVAEGENERAGRWTGFDKKECGIHTFLPMAVTR